MSHFAWEGIENQWWRSPVSVLTTTGNIDTVCSGLEDMEAVSVVAENSWFSPRMNTSLMENFEKLGFNGTMRAR